MTPAMMRPDPDEHPDHHDHRSLTVGRRRRIVQLAREFIAERAAGLPITRSNEKPTREKR